MENETIIVVRTVLTYFNITVDDTKKERKKKASGTRTQSFRDDRQRKVGRARYGILQVFTT